MRTPRSMAVVWVVEAAGGAASREVCSEPLFHAGICSSWSMKEGASAATWASPTSG